MDKDALEDQINDAVKAMREVSRNCQVSIKELSNAFAKLSNSGLKSLKEVAKVKQPWYIKVKRFFWNV